MKQAGSDEPLTGIIDEYKLKTYFSGETIRRMKLFACSKGDYTCRHGEPLDYLYLLVRGKLKIYTVTESGHALLLRFNTPLSVIGDVEFLSGYLTRCDVVAVHDSLLIGVPFRDLHRHDAANPAFLQFIIRNLSHKLYTATNSTALNLLYPVENRFASYLLSTASQNGDALSAEELGTPSLTELATLLGTSYRHLNRVIRRMADEGIIGKEKGKLLIKDASRLEVLSRGNLYE